MYHTNRESNSFGTISVSRVFTMETLLSAYAPFRDTFDDIMEDEEFNPVEFIEAKRYIGISSYDKQYRVN